MEPAPGLKYRPRRLGFVRVRSSKAYIGFTTCYAIFTDQFIFTAIVPILPFSLRQRNGVSPEKIHIWIAVLLGVYGAANLALSQALWGWFVDRRRSRRIPFLGGLLALLVSTLLLWLAPNLQLAVLARLCQGGAAGLVWVSTLAVLVDTVGESQMGEYMGYLGVATNAATLLGPFLGGIVFAKRGYNAVYILILGILAVDAILRILLIEPHTAATWKEDPPSSEVPLLISKLGVLPELERVAPRSNGEFGQLDPPGSAQEPEVDILSCQASESKRRLPTYRDLLLSPRLWAAVWGVLMQAAIGDCFKVALPLYVLQTFGWNSTGGGLIFLPLALPALLGPLFGMITDRLGPRWVAVGGFLAMAPCLFLLRLVDHDSTGQKVLLCALLVLIGLWITMTIEPLMVDITYLASQSEPQTVDDERPECASFGKAYSLFNAAWAAGNTLGPFWAGLVLSHFGWKILSITLGAAAGFSTIPALLWCGGWIFAPTLTNRDERQQEVAV